MVDASTAGLSDTDIQADRPIRVNTADPVGLNAHLHRFKVMQVGSAGAENRLLVVVQVNHPGYNGILGTDYWRSHRMWISYGSDTLTFASTRP